MFDKFVACLQHVNSFWSRFSTFWFP